MNLLALGWNPWFESQFHEAVERVGNPGLVPARVTQQHRGAYAIETDAGTMSATLPGKTVHAEDEDQIPAVGDWVAAETLPNESKAIVREVLPRRSRFVRRAAGETTHVQTVAANVDTVFLVSGLDGDFNPRRIERYLTLAWESGAMPVILLNKADLCPEVQDRIAEVEAIALGVDVHAVSAADGMGLDALAPYLAQGKTVAFLGSSGVGKSSIINGLLGADRMAIGGVRADDSRGRHTTTHRELVVLPDGAAMIDTPGMRELQLTGTASLDRSFADIAALAETCRFRDCTHANEPGCAVQTALDEGSLDRERYASYGKQLRELAYAERRESAAAERAHHAEWKKIARRQKAFYRENPKGSR